MIGHYQGQIVFAGIKEPFYLLSFVNALENYNGNTQNRDFWDVKLWIKSGFMVYAVSNLMRKNKKARTMLLYIFKLINSF